MESAITIGNYLIEHAKAAFGMMGADPAITAARHLLVWVDQKGGEGFIARTAFNANQGRFKNMEAFKVALMVLVDHGYLRIVEAPTKPGPGRKPSSSYRVNPAWKRA